MQNTELQSPASAALCCQAGAGQWHRDTDDDFWLRGGLGKASALKHVGGDHGLSSASSAVPRSQTLKSLPDLQNSNCTSLLRGRFRLRFYQWAVWNVYCMSSSAGSVGVSSQLQECSVPFSRHSAEKPLLEFLCLYFCAPACSYTGFTLDSYPEIVCHQRDFLQHLLVCDLAPQWGRKEAVSLWVYTLVSSNQTPFGKKSTK